MPQYIWMPVYVWMCPVCLDGLLMFGHHHICLDGYLYVWMPSIPNVCMPLACFDAPICLDITHSLDVPPLFFGCPPYVFMPHCYVWMPPVYLDTTHVWMPLCLDTPMCLDALTVCLDFPYVWMAPVCLHGPICLDTPICLDAPYI